MRDTDLLALSGDACAYLVRGASPPDAQRATLPADRTAWPAQAFARMNAPAAPFQAVFADSAVKYYVVTPPSGLQRFAELRDLAALRLEELFGTDSAAWRISADWSSRHPFLCCAVQNQLIAPLEEYAGPRLLSAAPIFVRRYNAAARSIGKPAAWFVCCTGGWVTAAYFDGGACHGVRSTALPSLEGLARWLGNEALLANRPLAEVWLSCATQHTLVLPGANVHRAEASGPNSGDQRDLQLLAALALPSPAPVAA